MDPILSPPPPENIGLLAIGEALIDAITTDFVDDLSQAETLHLFPGGSPANLCRFVQACGGKATLVAAVGKDGLGKMLLRSFERAGIRSAYIQQLEAHATSMIIVARSKHTPDFIPYRDADLYLQPADDQLISQASIVHTTAFALSRSPARQNILLTFKSAHQKGIAVSVDWNYAKPIWGNVTQAQEVFRQVMAYEPLLKVSMDDVERFTEKQLTTPEAKSFLQDLPASVVCLTCGAEGVWYKARNTDWQHIAAHPVEVKDATGAGDAFWAGFLTYYMQEQALESCVTHGIATAARRLEGKM